VATASGDRLQRLGATAISGFIGKGIAACATFAMVPLLLHSMGTELFGLWSTLHSLLAMSAFADFGIGNGMLNAITRSNAKNDLNGVQATITSGLMVLTCIAAILAVALFTFFHAFGGIITASGLSEASLGPALGGVAIFGVYAIVSMPLSTGDRIATALQEGFIPHLIRAVVLALSAIIVLVMSRTGAGFVALCGATVLPSLLGSFLTWTLVARRRPWLLPKLSTFSSEQSGILMRTGAGFCIIQLVSAVGFNIDTLLIARGAGVDGAADFAVASRYFSVATVVGNILLPPLWPAYADAMSRGEIYWVKRALGVSLLATLVCGGAIVGFLFVAKGWLVPLWLGDSLHLDAKLMCSMAGWTLISLIGSAIAMFWNGMHWLRLQCILGAAYAFTALPLKLWLSTHGTVDQYLIANALCFLVVELLPGIGITYMLLSRFQTNMVNRDSK